MAIRTLDKADLKDKIVLVRADYNVPMEGLKIVDNTRIVENMPTIRDLLNRGVKKVVIISHLGRPLGSVVEELRLKPIVAELESCLGEEVDYFSDDINLVTREKIESSTFRVICLENIRFDQREENGGEDLAKKISELADIFVLDAFSVAHRAHASVVGVAKFLPTYAGLALIKEYESINIFLKNVRKPFWGFFGGIKLDDKMPVIKSLVDKLNGIAIGSSIAVAFLKRYGFGVGDSIVSKDSEVVVDQFLEFVLEKNIQVVYPRDLIIGDSLSFRRVKVFDIDFNKIIKKEVSPIVVCEDGEGIYDVGEKSVIEYQKVIGAAGSVFWNGPFGWVEKDEFSQGTIELARFMAKSPAQVLIGGGDTVGFVAAKGMVNEYDFVSTSGGAMLEYIANGTLPGLDIVKE
ncbi:MAG: phosphoglycerate kinase [Patescibacteria group bacterium]